MHISIYLYILVYLSIRSRRREALQPRAAGRGEVLSISIYMQRRIDRYMCMHICISRYEFMYAFFTMERERLQPRAARRYEDLSIRIYTHR